MTTPTVRVPLDTSDIKIDQLKRRSGEELLDEYQDLNADQDWLIACYQRAIIEKYAEEIGYTEGEH